VSKAIIIPDLAYTSPKGRRGGNSNGYKEMIARIKYLQYRNDADGHIPQEKELERWVDHGLGRNYRDIFNRCVALGSGSVLAWTWVISPSPDLLALVPQAERAALVVALTEDIVDSYYEVRGMEQPEYSLVLHDRVTNETKDTPAPEHQLHTHVVLPGTVSTVAGERVAFYNRSNKGHVQLLQDIATERFAVELDRRVGPEWHALRIEVESPALPEPELAALPPVDPQALSELDRWFSMRPAQRERDRERGFDIS